MNLCLVLDVTALSTALYSNDCFIVSKEQVDKDNQRQHREGAILEDQKGLLTMDDIEDSSSDEEMNVRTKPKGKKGADSITKVTPNEVLIIDSN
jgi:hypothetical protein